MEENTTGIINRAYQHTENINSDMAIRKDLEPKSLEHNSIANNLEPKSVEQISMEYKLEPKTLERKSIEHKLEPKSLEQNSAKHNLEDNLVDYNTELKDLDEHPLEPKSQEHNSIKYILEPKSLEQNSMEQNLEHNIIGDNKIESQCRTVLERSSKTECDVLVDFEKNKFKGPIFKSFRDENIRRTWKRCSLRDEEKNESRSGTPELSRSQYSLVSTGDLTAGAIQLWMGLPEEVKYDAALAPFRQNYEKEHGKVDNQILKAINGNVTKKRLPTVNSAPHLNNNVHDTKDEVIIQNAAFIKCSPNDEKKEKLLEDDHIPKKTKIAKTKHFFKMTMLIACWIFFTLIFLMYNEKDHFERHTSIAPGEVKSYILKSDDAVQRVLLKLSGPFLSDHAEKKLNSSVQNNLPRMDIWLKQVAEHVKPFYNTSDKHLVQNSWSIILEDETQLDFNLGEKRSNLLKLVNSYSNHEVTLHMRTTSNRTTPFTMSYTLNPLDVSTGVIYACLLLCALYVLIIFEIINRTMAAVLISTTSLAALAIAGERPTLGEVMSWLDVETLLLLFSMMLLVAIMAETGIFDFLAVFTFEVTKGKIWPLISLLCAITAILSTFLDNVTTVLLMTPVTIRLCEVMELDPIPVLMSMVIYSNIGGTATPVGDPPNVIIASNRDVIQAGVNFTNFTLHMTFGILLVCVQTYLQLRFIYRDTKKLRLNEPREIQDLRLQLSIWRRAADSIPQLSKDQHVVKERLERKVRKLTSQLDILIKQSKNRACPKETFQSTLDEMKGKYKIRDKGLLVKSSIAISFVVALFFLHSVPELNRVSLGWTAFLGAILLLTLADREDLEPILHRVEWSTLIFFAALFVMMEALSKLGLIEYIGGITESIILRVDESARLAVAILLLLWVSGVTSAFVDNIPLTTMMVRVVTSLGTNPTLNLPIMPLIWALSFGACLGGNGTLIGASANVVCAGVAEQHGYKFSFLQFFKVGFPIMVGHLIVASGYLLLCHCVFTWH